MKEVKKAVVICSGGMDSVTLLHDVKSSIYLDAEIEVLSFDYGQRHKKELMCARMNAAHLQLAHKIVDVSAINCLLQGSALTSNVAVPEGHYAEESMKMTVVPNRNMVMLSLALAYAISIDAQKVFYGAHSGDHAIYPDCRPVFVQAMRTAALLCDWKQVDIEAPYLEKDKITILERGKILGVDYSKTWTCYNGRGKACGRCGACVERLEAFRENGITDPLEYEES